jgi:2-polyprenyl-3-methyl-5-hydroxy-6-metoxy-1,4-benzoquinol methylase
MAGSKYNKTQLDPAHFFELHYFHRDLFAHFFRWSHILKVCTKLRGKCKVLDFGCADGQLCEVLYRNRCAPEKYVGMDIRQQSLEKVKAKLKDLPWVEFVKADLVEDDASALLGGETFDVVVCFEVLEHVGKQNVPKLLANMKECGSADATYYISTPNYDPNVGAADNHTVNGEIYELAHEETARLLYDAGFDVVAKYGTFASQKDIEPLMTDEQRKLFFAAKEYYDSNILSNMFAFMFPEQARNCMWVCKRRS